VGIKRENGGERLWFLPILNVLKSLTFRIFPKNCPREWRVGLKIFACVCWSFGRWFNDNGVCFLRSLIKKLLRLACAFHAHQHTLQSNLDLHLLTLFGSLTLMPMTPAILDQKEPQERQRRFKSKSQLSIWQLLQERQKMKILLGQLLVSSLLGEGYDSPSTYM
jgi:hypothetical protein